MVLQEKHDNTHNTIYLGKIKEQKKAVTKLQRQGVHSGRGTGQENASFSVEIPKD